MRVQYSIRWFLILLIGNNIADNSRRLFVASLIIYLYVDTENKT